MQLDPVELADFIAETVVDAVKPLHKQLAEQHGLIVELQRRLESLPDPRAIVVAELEKLPTPRDGKDADPDAILEAARAAVAELPKPVDGKDADQAAIDAAAKAAVDALPKPQDGRSVTVEEVAPLLRELVAEAVAAIPAPKDGLTVTVTADDVLPALIAELQKAVEAIPLPADGKSVTIDDVLPVLESMHAKWELDFERRAQDLFQRALDRMPAPKNGEDGKDGLGFDDFTFEQVDERSAVLRFTRGAVVKEFLLMLPGFVDKGVWQEGEFVKGDGVTWDGSYWLARRATTAKPGSEGEDTGNNDWRLAVRKGRKGKDGAPGRDLRSVVAKLPT
jgi:hypothetical protein